MKHQMKVLFGIAPLLSPFVASAAISAKSYVSDGLVALWDAKENTGYGSHSDNPENWVDLTGKAFPIGMGTTTFTETNYPVTHASGRTVAAATLSATDLYKSYAAGTFTAEIAYNQNAETEKGGAYSVRLGAMVSVGSYDVFIGAFNDERIGFNSYGNKGSASLALTVGGISTLGSHTYSCRQDGANWSVDFDGTATASGSNAGGAKSGAASYSFGLNREGVYGNDGINGGYHAIRFYSRPLTDDEVAVNRAVDQIRYFGADPASYTLPSGWRFTEGPDVKLERQATIAVQSSACGMIRIAGGEPTLSETIWVEQGSSVALAVVAEPAAGYVFEGWTGACEVADALRSGAAESGIPGSGRSPSRHRRRRSALRSRSTSRGMGRRRSPAELRRRKTATPKTGRSATDLSAPVPAL